MPLLLHAGDGQVEGAHDESGSNLDFAGVVQCFLVGVQVIRSLYLLVVVHAVVVEPGG